MVDFLVDTGAKTSAITEKEATIMGIVPSSLPFARQRSIGFGGFFRNRMINRRVVLTFKWEKDERRIVCSCFRVNCIPPNVKGKDREESLRYIPNVLGMDILRRFKIYVDRNLVELVYTPK